MHKLSREIRFTISPFEQLNYGYNSYCSSPDCKSAMGLFFSLWAELTGDIDAQTGFIVNLSEIDEVCRREAVPVFDSMVKNTFEAAKPLTFAQLIEALSESIERLTFQFKMSKLYSLAIKTNPYRQIKMFAENKKVIHYSEKFEFAAMHKLWNDRFSRQENFAKFGKCANPQGHGHNYIVEVTIEIPAENNFDYGGFQKIVDENLIELLDHQNLNSDVEYFRTLNPTVENITTYAWQRLQNKFQGARLEEVTVWENDRAYCSYRN
jgi:6-pyruvoyltetrahydropterin/6-carboxytetrahydropterin synthase